MKIKRTPPKEDKNFNRAPMVTRYEVMSSVDFLTAVKRFCQDYLRGVAEFQTVDYPGGYLTLCPEQTAYLLKLLVDATPRGSMLIITADCDRENLIIKAELDTDDGDEDCFARAAALAQRIGFSAATTRGGIILKTALTRSNCFSVYARSPERFYLMLKKFVLDFNVNED